MIRHAMGVGLRNAGHGISGCDESILEKCVTII